MKIVFQLFFTLIVWFFFTACESFSPQPKELPSLDNVIKPSASDGLMGESIEGLAESCSSETISMTDCEGETQIISKSRNVYDIVEIGGMCWFAQNLQEIPSYFFPPPLWENNSNNGWYGYPSNFKGGLFQDNGYLYTWAAAMNLPNCLGGLSLCQVSRIQGACPLGWHIPSDCEFKALENALEMLKNEQDRFAWRDSGRVGTKLKVNGSSGFNASMSSYRNGNDGSFNTYGLQASFWSSTEVNELASIIRILNSEEEGIFYYPEGKNKSDAHHVRCLKD